MSENLNDNRQLQNDEKQPKFPQYALYKNRLQSFADWPKNISVKKEEMAEKGLFYSGVDDCVRCYLCGKWERNALVLEHAFWKSKCPHVKGQCNPKKLVVKEKLEKDDAPSRSDVKQVSKPDIPVESDIVKMCACIGYSKENIEKAVDIYRNKHGHINFKIKDLIEIIVDIEGRVYESPSKVDSVTDISTATKCVDVIGGLGTDMARLQYADYVRRLESFNAWPVNIPVSKESFAQAGLVYTGVGDSVRCFYCDVEMSNWENSNVLMERYAKCSPKCPRIILAKAQGYVDKRSLVKTQICNDVAKQNFIYRESKVLGTDDANNTFSSYAKKSELQKFFEKYAANNQWTNADVAHMKHAGQRDTVCFPKTAIEMLTAHDLKDMIDDTLSVDGNATDDEESSSDSSQAGDNVAVEEQNQTIPKQTEVNLKRPKFHEYAVYSKRLETFASWPDHSPIKKEDLAEAGLFYTGIGDRVRCFFCGGNLWEWEIGDVPKEAHASFYPTCPNINLAGSVGEGPDVSITSQVYSRPNASQRSDDDLLTSVAAQSCIQMGFSEEMVKKAIYVYVTTTGKDYTGKDLCEILLELDDQNGSLYPTDNTEGIFSCANESERDEHGDDDNESLLEENKRLKEPFTCVKCTEKMRSVVFIPCGHLVCCSYCASSLSKCPLPCGKKIENQQNVFFARFCDVNG